MLLNYLKLSLRLLARNPFFTFINVLGLAVGFASFFILWQHATTELNSDQFLKDADRIVRLNLNWQWTDDGKTWGMNTFGATRFFQAPRFQNDFPEVESFSRFFQQPDFNEDLVGHGNRVVVALDNKNVGEELFEETKVIYADPNFFDFFGLPLLKGSPTMLLSESHSVALSESTAIKYFGYQEPLGRLLMVNDTILLKVTGVFRDLPHNTHLAFDLVISDVGLTDHWQERHYPLVATYLKLYQHSQVASFGERVNTYRDEYWASELKRSNFKVDFVSQPVTDLSFNPQYWYVYNYIPKSRSQLILFRVIAVLILVMAWVNYVNLAVSRMMKRMTEVATRKMSGALSFDFAKQFLIEAGVTNIIALLLALTVQQLARVPAMTNLQIYVPEFNAISSGTWILFGGIALFGIGVTGAYPAVMSMTYNPRTLLIRSKGTPREKGLPKFLVTFQYTAGMILILWTFVVYLQLNFILYKDVGLNRDQIVIIDAPMNVDSNYANSFSYFTNEVRNIAGVSGVTSSYTIIGDSKDELFWVNNIRQPDLTATSTNGGVDENFIPFYGIRMIAGRNFLPSDKDDAIIVSRHAAFRLGFNKAEEAVGNQVKVRNGRLVHVIGVIEDYRFKSLANLDWSDSENVNGQGICLVYKNHLIDWYTPRKLSVKVEGDQHERVLARIKERYDRVFTGNVFNWFFLDDHINRFYENERVNRNQIIMFTLLAIGISCLGILGMMKLNVEAKTKEIGIRKVLGAGMKSIINHLLKDVTLPVAVATGIALPVSYYLTRQYFERYLEKIDLQWWHFALPVTILVLLMLAAVASVVWKAAKSNPVDALKNE